MDEDSMVTTSKVKGEATNKIKDGYVQLAEKMEQVRNQVAKMERKYDELYQTVKEKEHSRNASLSSTSDPESPEESKSQRETTAETTSTSAKQSIGEVPLANPPDKKSEENPKPGDMDIEKMEDNPFL